MNRWIAALLAISATALAQTGATTVPETPKDPLAVLRAAAPLYDFSNSAMKPWHLKASYQLYDEKGNPASQGTYEYWWASPSVDRSSWARADATHTDWHTSDGKHAYLSTGTPIEFFEYKLQAALISPMPKEQDYDPNSYRLDRELKSAGGSKLSCIMVVPKMPANRQVQTVPLGLFPTYCFDSATPALRISYSFGTISTEFNHIVRFPNGPYLAREIFMFEGKRKILTAEVNSITTINGSDPALVASPNAVTTKFGNAVPVSAGVSAGNLVKKEVPVYPEDAKAARLSGRVVLRAIIGMDGAVHDLHVVSTPWPSLAASSLWAVSHWRYKPYMLNGEPVDVDTTINVIFSVGN
ncbi:MAG TPA: energy transducer TonB [Terracidiphilus sp.]|nr:energy transducer TonB [Terracidiphilus sp.]